MNHVLFSFLLIIAVGAFLIASADNDCCSYPVLGYPIDADVSARDFQCNEEIHIQCAGYEVNISIAGLKDPADRSHFEIVEEGRWHAGNTIVCNSSTNSWHLKYKKHPVEYKCFVCASSYAGGPWTLV
ncbi:hypothetical protein CAEBREN_19653 [Caenorhabditis brenneri]|uniref:Uncharacterized protein n=1 Tax=Caenorhabditis brenneri TaxID=135651 RepID=G0NI32_CAEBE|nr:hypothetical protein CAEBREN_19653 [Caenorhabditis brenneri]